MIGVYYQTQGDIWKALIYWNLNRLFDGVDGAYARATNQSSDFGGYFDILIDFTVYGFVPLGIAVHMENLEVFKWVCILEITFFVNAAGLFFLSALIEKNQAAKVSFLGLLEKLR